MSNLDGFLFNPELIFFLGDFLFEGYLFYYLISENCIVLGV